MTHGWAPWRSWLAACAAALLAAGCGGGGGGPSPPPDARNGDYTAYAANARQYTLNLNFDTGRYRMSGNGLDESGGFGTDANGLFFMPAGVIVGANTARFALSNDTVIGAFRFAEGVLPIVAPRVFASTVAEAAGNYNFLTRTVETAGAANIAIFNGEITTGGQLRTCNDSIIYRIAECPAASVVAGTLTVSGTEFTSTTPGGAFTFRIARIGTDKVLLRASPSTATARRFWVGTPGTSAYAAGGFAGGNTDGHWSSFSVSPTSHSATLMLSTGGTATRSGTSTTVGAGELGSLLRLSTASGAQYFSIRATNLGVIAATRDSTQVAGFMEIGKAQ